VSEPPRAVDGAPEGFDQLAASLRERIRGSAFHQWAGIELTTIEPGTVEVTLQVEPHHLNPAGIVHGGVIAAMADAASGLALRTVLGVHSRHVTGHLNVQYLAPGTHGRIVGRGRVIKAGERAAFAEADIVDDRGRTLARATATFIVMRQPAAHESE